MKMLDYGVSCQKTIWLDMEDPDSLISGKGESPCVARLE